MFLSFYFFLADCAWVPGKSSPNGIGNVVPVNEFCCDPEQHPSPGSSWYACCPDGTWGQSGWSSGSSSGSQIWFNSWGLTTNFNSRCGGDCWETNIWGFGSDRSPKCTFGLECPTFETSFAQNTYIIGSDWQLKLSGNCHEQAGHMTYEQCLAASTLRGDTDMRVDQANQYRAPGCLYDTSRFTFNNFTDLSTATYSQCKDWQPCMCPMFRCGNNHVYNETTGCCGGLYVTVSQADGILLNSEAEACPPGYILESWTYNYDFKEIWELTCNCVRIAPSSSPSRPLPSFSPSISVPSQRPSVGPTFLWTQCYSNDMSECNGFRDNCIIAECSNMGLFWGGQWEFCSSGELVRGRCAIPPPTISMPTLSPSTSNPSTRPTTSMPSKTPTTSSPTRFPTHHPTGEPSFHPTQEPTVAPTLSPTSPTYSPTCSPSQSPSASAPTVGPTIAILTSIFRFNLDYASTNINQFQAAFELFLQENGYGNVTILAISEGSIVVQLSGPNSEISAVNRHIASSGGVNLSGDFGMIALATYPPSRAPTNEPIVVTKLNLQHRDYLSLF